MGVMGRDYVSLLFDWRDDLKNAGRNVISYL